MDISLRFYVYGHYRHIMEVSQIHITCMDSWTFDGQLQVTVRNGYRFMYNE